jgi:hypothetical protein
MSDTLAILKDTHAEDLVTVLQFQTDCGKKQFLHDLHMSTTADVHHLKRIQESIQKERKTLAAFNPTVFELVGQIEPKLETVLSPTSLDKESFEQILFSNWKILEILNTIPFCLFVISIWKQYVVPVLAICMPFLFFFGPYIALRYVYKLDIGFDAYLKIFFQTIGIDGKFEMKQTVQLFLTAISIGQSMYQPVQNAFHIRKIDNDLQEKGRAIIQLRYVLETLYPGQPEKNPLFDLDEKDIHKSFADCWDLPFRLRIAFQNIGEKEVLYRLAACEELRLVSWNKRGAVLFKDAKNPFQADAIPFSVLLKDGKQHCILTGPNGGGKSSFMRSFLLNLFLAQKFGLFFGSATSVASIHPFDWIASGLRLEDTPGLQSLFEREVQFAADTLQKKNRGFLIFDELFHSTNPPDGERTASIFLQSVWSKKNLTSIISTHVFSLADTAPSHVVKLCVPARQLDDGSIKFEYKLQQGVCKVSSVDLVFQKCGFPRSRKT